MELARLLSTLDAINKQRGPTYVRDFERVLDAIYELKDPASIGALCEYFEDNAPFDELMFSIIHSIETFDTPVYVAHMLAAAPRLQQRSTEWAVVVFLRIVNSPPHRAELISQLHQASPEIRNVLRVLMTQVASQSEKLAVNAEPVLDVLK